MSIQAGFYDIDERYARLREAGDPHEKLDVVVPWDVFFQTSGQGAEAIRWREERQAGV